MKLPTIASGLTFVAGMSLDCGLPFLFGDDISRTSITGKAEMGCTISLAFTDVLYVFDWVDIQFESRIFRTIFLAR